MEKALSLALVQDQPAQFENILTTESRFLRCNCKLAGKTYELYLFHRLQASQGHVTYLIPKLCENNRKCTMWLRKHQWKYLVNFRAKTTCYFHTYKIIVGFTLEARLVSSEHLIQEHLEILRRSVETWLQTCWQSVLVLMYKLSISPFIRILKPLLVHIVHIALISYWSGVFSRVL